jgi:hypothetical protein
MLEDSLGCGAEGDVEAIPVDVVRVRFASSSLSTLWPIPMPTTARSFKKVVGDSEMTTLTRRRVCRVTILIVFL